jgi:hypothetical protein
MGRLVAVLAGAVAIMLVVLFWFRLVMWYHFRFTVERKQVKNGKS